jgi:hypothetical protein
LNDKILSVESGCASNSLRNEESLTFGFELDKSTESSDVEVFGRTADVAFIFAFASIELDKVRPSAVVELDADKGTSSARFRESATNS